MTTKWPSRYESFDREFMIDLPQILLVEKEQSIINQITDMVEKIGFKAPKVAGTSEEAAAIAGNEKPDIALVDLSSDGQSTARMLQDKYDMPVIFLASEEYALDKKDSQTGPDFILKPVDRRNFKKTIMLALSRHARADSYTLFLSDIPVPAFLVNPDSHKILKVNSAFNTFFPGKDGSTLLEIFGPGSTSLTKLIDRVKSIETPEFASIDVPSINGLTRFKIIARRLDLDDRAIILVSMPEEGKPGQAVDTFDIAPAMMVQMDANGKLLRANQKWLVQTGYAWSEIEGKHFPQFLAEVDEDILPDKFYSAVANGSNDYEVSLDLRHRNGEIVTYQVHISGKAKDHSMLAAFIENRAIPELIRYKEEAILSNALRDTASALTSTLNFDEVLDRILVNVGEVVPNEAANVMMIWSGIAYIVRSIGYAERGIEDEMMSIQVPVTQESHFLSMFTTGMPLAVSDIDRYAALEKRSKVDWARSMASAPLKSKGQVFGFLNLESSQPGFYNQNHADRLQAFADQAAVAIENARLYAEVQQFAITDELTDIYNRRGLFELGKREVERAHRYGRNLSAVMIDTDGFKSVNDNYSHAVGDQVLRSMADRWKACIREVDILGRYGGDEFVVLLPETEIEYAFQVADRLRMAICDKPIETSMGNIPLSVSVGVAALGDAVTTFDELIEIADHAMFKAKETGKNRVIK